MNESNNTNHEDPSAHPSRNKHETGPIIKPTEPDGDKAVQNETGNAMDDGLFAPMGLNPEDLQKEFKDLIEKKFGGRVQVMTMADTWSTENSESVEKASASKPPSSESLNQSDENNKDDEHHKGIKEFSYKPKDIKKYLDRFIIGQDEAKKALAIAVCDHYLNLKNELLSPEKKLAHYQKQNVLLLGPTGVGKTYMVKLISEWIGVPFVKADATRFSEVGYMGANVDDVIRDLVQKAKGDLSKASHGIVYVDEVDKLASKKDHMGRDVNGRGVQFGFLRLLENTDVDLNANHDIASQFKTLMSFQKKGRAEKEVVNTKNILFIFSGAFHGLEEIITNRLHKKSIGLHTAHRVQEGRNPFQLMEAQDLIDFGFEHEFIGRLPVRVSCDHLNEEDLYQILTQSEHSIVQQYVLSFANYGLNLKFTPEALRLLAQKALAQKTGARALNAVFEDTLRSFKFELPSSQIKNLEVNADLVKNPEGYLLHLLN